MQEWLNRHRFSLFFFLWFAFFFPSWYVLSCTKVHEIRQLFLQPRERQLEVLHPLGEMDQLLELKHTLQTQFADRAVAVLAQPQSTEAPLATDASIQRAVFYPTPVLAALEITDQAVLVAVIPRSHFVASVESSEAQEANGELIQERCRQLAQVPETYQGEVVCWPISPR